MTWQFRSYFHLENEENLNSNVNAAIMIVLVSDRIDEIIDLCNLNPSLYTSQNRLL